MNSECVTVGGSVKLLLCRIQQRVWGGKTDFFWRICGLCLGYVVCVCVCVYKMADVVIGKAHLKGLLKWQTWFEEVTLNGLQKWCCDFGATRLSVNIKWGTMGFDESCYLEFNIVDMRMSSRRYSIEQMRGIWTKTMGTALLTSCAPLNTHKMVPCGAVTQCFKTEHIYRML